jgi:hypothetical protein
MSQLFRWLNHLQTRRDHLRELARCQEAPSSTGVSGRVPHSAQEP